MYDGSYIITTETIAVWDAAQERNKPHRMGYDGLDSDSYWQ